MGRPKKLLENQLYIFSFRMTRPTYQRLRALSRHDSLSQQEHLRRAVEIYLDKMEIPEERLREVMIEDSRKFHAGQPESTAPPRSRRSLPKRLMVA